MPSADRTSSEALALASGEPAARSGLSLLGNARFRALFVAHFASNVGDWLAFMALFSLSTFEWKTDVLGIGILGTAYMLPYALVSPWAGVWVDRWDLRRVLVWGDLLRGALVLAMAFTSSFALLAALLFLHQAVACFFNPAQHAAIPRIVARTELLSANALNAQAAQVSKILGPGVAGALVGLLGVRGCFLLDATTFALSALLLATLPALPAASARLAGRSFADDFRVGWAALLRPRRMRAVVVILMLSLGVLGAFIAVLPVFARDALQAGPRTMGILLSTLGAGAAAGAFGVMHAGKQRDRLALIAGGTVLSALSVVALSFTTSVAWSALATAGLGVGTTLLVVPAHALFQEEIPSAQLARVVSLALAFLALSQAAGMGVAGWACKSVTTATLLRGSGVILLGVGLPLWTWSRMATRRRPG